MVEFAIYLPVFLVLILMAFYVAEVGLDHQDAEVAIRHEAWHALRVPPMPSDTLEETNIDVPSITEEFPGEDTGTTYQASLSAAWDRLDEPVGTRYVNHSYTERSAHISAAWGEYEFTKDLVLDPASIGAVQSRQALAWEDAVGKYQLGLVLDSLSALSDDTSEPGGWLNDVE